MMSEKGVASYYENTSPGLRKDLLTHSREKFDDSLLTVAVPQSRWKELKKKKLKVTSLDTGRSVEVRVNDSGGFEKYGRSLDLSRAAFEAIANPAKGLTNIEWEVVGDEEEKERQEEIGFKEAFRKARASGVAEFVWKGKSYTTKYRGE